MFLRLSSSHVLLAVITLFLQTLAFYHVNDVKVHTSEQQLKDLGSHFEKSAFGPSVWIQVHIDINFTKLGATAFIISFLRIRCGAHLIHQPTADDVVEPLRENLIAFMSAYRDAMTKNLKTQILHKSYEKNTKTIYERDCMRVKQRSGTNFPKIVEYKPPSRSKLNNLTG